MPKSTNLSTAIPQGLTAAEFFAAVQGLLDAHALVPIIDLPDELKSLQCNINVSAEAAGRLARNLADGRFGGLAPFPLRKLKQDAETLFKTAYGLEQRLYRARMSARLPPRLAADNAHGSSAIIALARVLYGVTGVVLQIANNAANAEYERRLGANEDGAERPSVDDALEWKLTTKEIQDRFANGFAFPDPGPLFHEMRIELIALAEVGNPVVPIIVEMPAKSESPTPATPPFDPDPIACALVLMVQWESEPRRYTVEDLAKAAGTSKSALYRNDKFAEARKALTSTRRPHRGYMDAGGNLEAAENE